MIEKKEEGLVEIGVIEEKLSQCLRQFESSYVHLTEQDSSMSKNNHMIVPVLRNLMEHRLFGIKSLFQLLTDEDIMNIACSCKALYRYIDKINKLVRHLRPRVIVRYTQPEIPHFPKSTVEQLCRVRSLANMDEDDKLALLLTIKTNIIASRQKVAELDSIIQEYDRKSEKVLDEIMYIGGEREEQQRKNNQVMEQIEKLKELLRASEGHAESLKEEQEKMIMERDTKLLLLRQEKDKLERQKELLIKKIKSQQKQKEEGLIYAKEVGRILNKLTNITSNKK